jgi:tetratricopeptide (TPR) repeat protein
MRQSTSIRLIIFFAVCVAFEVRATPVPEIVAKAKPAVVQVIASDANWSPIRTGTGFFVSADGDLLTNFHVIQGATHITARTDKGAIFVFERVLAESADSDVALLKFQATEADFLKLGNSTNAVEGETVLVIGNPEGLQGTVSNGIISAFRENRSYIQITAPISAGSSGSPVLDETGQVIGMATLISKSGQNLNFAISTEVIDAVVRSSLAQGTPVLAETPFPVVNFDSAAYERRAISDLTEQIRQDPSDPYLYYARGDAYKDLEDFDKAISDFTKALKLNAQFSEASNAHMMRADAYYELKQYNKAIEDCTATIKDYNPDDRNLEANRAYAFKRRGLVYDQLRQYNKAVSDYTDALRLDPRSPGEERMRAETYRMRAETYHVLRDYKAEIADYTEAIRLLPNHSRYYEARGFAYEAIGDKKGASVDREKAKQLGLPEN